MDNGGPDNYAYYQVRDMAEGSPTYGHFVAWIGRYEDILAGRGGQYRVKLLHSHARKVSDCAYPSVHLLPNGDFFAATYIKYDAGSRRHSTVCLRFNLKETDQILINNKRFYENT